MKLKLLVFGTGSPAGNMCFEDPNSLSKGIHSLNQTPRRVSRHVHGRKTGDAETCGKSLRKTGKAASWQSRALLTMHMGLYHMRRVQE